MTDQIAFQDRIPNNNCFGCGPHNKKGLRIKSFWSGADTAICRFRPSPHHSAGPLHTLNGGIISTLIDCHSLCTAMAKAYQMAGRDIGTGELIWFVTGWLSVSYKKPVPIDADVMLTATVLEAKEKKITLSCTVHVEGQECAAADVVAVRAPGDWFEDHAARGK